MLTISKQDQELLFLQSQLKKLESGEYIRDESNENFKYIKDKFFAFENVDKAKLLNIGSGLFTSIPDIISYYIGNPSIDLGVLLDQFSRDLVTLGFCTLGIERENSELKLVYQPAKNYRYENGIDKISRLYIDDNNKIYVLVQSYPVGYIENKLYLMKNSSLSGGVEVPLDTIPQTSQLQPIINTGLEVPALIVVKDTNISTISKIKQLVYAVDRQIVMNHTQYLQNMESFIVFKGIKRPQKLLDDYNEGKRVNFSQIGRIINGNEDSSIEFVNNINSLIDKAIIDEENNIRRISSISCVPIEFLGLENNEGAIGMGSRSLRHGAFIKKIEYYRGLFDEAISLFLELKKQDEPYTRPDVFAKSDTELVNELSTARTAGIISKYNAIKKYNDYTDEETLNELELINNEQALQSNEDGQGI